MVVELVVSSLPAPHAELLPPFGRETLLPREILMKTEERQNP